MKRARASIPLHWLAASAVLTEVAAASPSAAQAPPADTDEEITVPAKPAPAVPPPSPAARPVTPPPAVAPTAPPLPPPPASSPSAEVEELRRELREDRVKLAARVEALEAELAARKAAGPSTWALPAAGFGGPVPGQGVWGINAYVQAQYEQHQSSADQIGQSGAYLNQDRFLVRRGRLRLDAAWEHVELALEIDGNTTSTPTVGPTRLEASVLLRGKPWEGKLGGPSPRVEEVPLGRLTLGLTGIPFGFELQDFNRDRVFLERTQASQAFFPGDTDLGAVLAGGVGFFRYSVAAMNGTPLGSGSLPVGDPTHAKDILARFGADGRPSEAVRVAGGVSALYGTGFHAGTPATKASVIWVDQNQNGVIDAGELMGVPGQAATPSATFTHWGLGVDLSVRFRTALGETMVYGEATLAQNLDRGVYVADPVETGINVRELGGYVGLVQEITRYGLLGFRFDYYNPNLDIAQATGGQLLPFSAAIQTYSPLIGLQLPDRARLIFEYDVVRNNLGISPTGVPTDLAEDHFAVRLQVQL